MKQLRVTLDKKSENLWDLVNGLPEFAYTTQQGILYTVLNHYLKMRLEEGAPEEE